MKIVVSRGKDEKDFKVIKCTKPMKEACEYIGKVYKKSFLKKYCLLKGFKRTGKLEELAKEIIHHEKTKCELLSKTSQKDFNEKFYKSRRKSA